MGEYLSLQRNDGYQQSFKRVLHIDLIINNFKR